MFVLIENYSIKQSETLFPDANLSSNNQEKTEPYYLPAADRA